MKSTNPRLVGRLLIALLAVFAMSAAVVSTPSDAQDVAQEELSYEFKCLNRDYLRSQRLLKCTNVEDVVPHLRAFQAIADANGGGIRASGTPGYDQSADYVAGLLEEAGLIVERQEFAFSLFREESSFLTSDGEDVATQTMSYSGSGSVTDGNLVAVDLDLGPDNGSTSGCEATDFDGLDFSGPADIALMQRGACAFADKAVNANAAGAELAIIFNQGNTDDRKDIIGGTLGEGVVGVISIPVIDIAYDDAVALLDAESISGGAETTIVTNTTENIIADMPGVNPDNVLMSGAHLDSVAAGPGVQDNGTGSAVLLGVALELANNTKYVPQNTLRFAWWGAEESGLIGSTEYIFNPDFGITDAEYEALAGYLNFDMIGSPNFIYGVYDADESTFAASAPVPAGSAALEDVFESYYSLNDIPYEDSEFSGRSDYQAFINVGIPASGLFTGAEGIKTDEQAAIWGGTAGEQYDKCYHLACDKIFNVNRQALAVNIDAVAYAIFHLAATTEAVNGVAGAAVAGRTPSDIPIDGAQGTFQALSIGGGWFTAGDTITN